MANVLSAAPAQVSATLETLKTQLLEAAGENLAGLIVYGGLARGRFVAGRSDVNVLLLVKDASAAALRCIAAPLHHAWRAASVEPMILTPAELPGAANCFPTKFWDISLHHIVLYGNDPFANFQVPHEHVRMRIEQELRNLQMRLRRRLISAGDDTASQARILGDISRRIALIWESLLRLTGRSLPADGSTTALMDAAAQGFDLNQAALQQLVQLRRLQQHEGDSISKLVDYIFFALNKTIDIAHQGKPTA